VHIRLRLAYSRDGRAMLELRRAILTDVDVVYARAVAPTSRFHDYQLLFQAALGSLRITEE
jgi:hypothetical protein